ncbi:TonB-dependent receptor domain-containing protein, partial [Escherichia coli]|uniref:TonB-dependent receptor domain-containing protein n=1 Tax=Escherichia coli TaxID=562 RepID=UPI003D81BE47
GAALTSDVRLMLIRSFTSLRKTVTLDWKPLALEDWSFYVSGHYTGQKRADSATAKTPGGYTIWNTGAAWQVTKDVKLRAGVLNLGDKDLSRDDYSYNEDGRRYFMAVDYRF